MDAKNKALFRAKLEASRKQKLDKRIDSPLVKYNESGQPICRVCDVVLKSDSHWEAHKVSTKHHEGINNFKANAAKLAQSKNVKPGSQTEVCEPEPQRPTKMQNGRVEPSADLHKSPPSAGLPADFFDSHKETKRQKTDFIQQMDISTSKRDDLRSEKDLKQPPEKIAVPDTNQAKGVLPEGFFDNKDADLRARGVELVKPNVKDEYKEFEKLIQEDLQEVENRYEEEEFDAAETIEEAETVEQRIYREKVEFLKNKQMELKAARSAKHGSTSKTNNTKSNHGESSSDDDSDGNFAVDWRAQHL